MRKPLLLLLFLLFAASCRKDFEEVNTNPFNPTQTSMEALFNGILASLQLGWSEQFYLHNETLYDLTQQGALISHAWPNIRIGVDEVWDNYYTTLRNVRALEERFDQYAGSQEELDNVRAMLKIVLAYKTFKVTDLFGDMPFFDAGRGGQATEFLRPKYDRQEDIYKFLLSELEWADAHIHLEPNTPGGAAYYSFRQFDTVLKSDLTKWRRWANSMRLRYGMRVAEKDPALAEQTIRKVLENKRPVVENGQDICLWPRDLGVQFNSHQWSFQEHKGMRMGTTMWHQLSVHDSTDGSGIIDPRAYVFFETNNKNQWRAFPNVPGLNPPLEGGIPYNGGRDFNYDVKGAACMFSPYNYYLVRDEYDVPEILLTAAEVHFLKAEASKRGIGTNQDDFNADAEYAEGIKASIKFWYSVVNRTQRWTENKPETPTDGQIYQYIYNPKVSFAGNGFKLDLIYTQAWIDMFRQPWEAYALARRTGKTPREGDPLTYNRFPYPATEAEYNQVNWQAQLQQMGGVDVKETKVWWMQ
jgi:hypothetical protein